MTTRYGHLVLDDGDEILHDWILSGRYLPTRKEVKAHPWMALAYDTYLSNKAKGRLATAFCGVCGQDDSHVVCYIGDASHKAWKAANWEKENLFAPKALKEVAA